LFQVGAYTPLHATGPKHEHVIALAREHHNQVAIIAVPRLSYILAAGALGLTGYICFILVTGQSSVFANRTADALSLVVTFYFGSRVIGH